MGADGDGSPPRTVQVLPSCLLEHEGWSTGPWLDRAPFERALVSWNAGPDARLELELRVAADGAASPWFPVASWTEARRAEPPAGGEAFGAIATDEFQAVAGRRFDALQLRVRLAGSRLERLFVCTTLAGPADPGPRPTRAVEVAVPTRSQHEAGPVVGPRACSPTSVAMALAREAEDPSSEPSVAAVAARAYDAAHDLYGVWPRAVAVAAERGLPGALVRLDGWGELARWLERGATVVASVTVEPGELPGAPYAHTAGHLLVVRGLDGRGGVLVNDPAAPDRASVARRYAVPDLEPVWFGRKGGLAYVFGQAVPEEVPRATEDLGAGGARRVPGE